MLLGFSFEETEEQLLFMLVSKLLTKPHRAEAFNVFQFRAEGFQPDWCLISRFENQLQMSRFDFMTDWNCGDKIHTETVGTFWETFTPKNLKIGAAQEGNLSESKFRFEPERENKLSKIAEFSSSDLQTLDQWNSLMTSAE